MTEPLQTALHDEADNCPEFELTADPWARGRRARRTRRIAVVVAGGVAALAVATMVSVGVGQQWSVDPVSPVEPAPGLREPTIPDRLYNVPPNMTDLADSPLGGPASFAYEAYDVRVGLFTEDVVAVVVGAHTGDVRAVRSLAGSIRGPVLSPDGTKLASGIGFGEGVRVVDVRTGELVTFGRPSVAVHQIWTPDGTRLAIGIDGEYGSQGRDGVLDIGTGEWQPRRYAAPIAFSPDGQRELRWDEDDQHWVVAEVDAGEVAALSLSASAQHEVRSGVFSPDGTMVAVAYREADESAAIAVFDVDTGESPGLFSHDRWSEPLLVGWGERGVLVRYQYIDAAYPGSDDGIDVIPWGSDGWGHPDRIVGGSNPTPRTSGTYFPMHVSIPASFLDADIRPAGKPDAPFDWFPWLIMLVIAAAVVLVVKALDVVRSLR
ncbi:MAG TPA: WD40 repeat domain-containing protein [Jiangellaceae bacterium]|nr:WD40 repeat domain-containing protein [Jiangellaceae bacterium]